MNRLQLMNNTDKTQAASGQITSASLLMFAGVIFMLLMTNTLTAQFYNGSNMTFGKNRVQYHNTIWSFYKFEDFDTYFYLNGKELALYTAWYTQQQLPALERKLETVLDDKMQFVIYNSLNELKQSNIGLAGEQQYNTGGITHILGNKVVLYNDGNYLNFEQQIRAGIADILITQLMYGGSIGSQIRNAALFTLPDWYKNGLISYLSEDWNSEIDNRLRDGMVSGRYKKINRLSGEDAIFAGHALWRYIEMKYGPSAITNIIHLTQLTRNVQNGFLYVTGLPFKELVSEWYTYYYDGYARLEAINPDETLPYRYRDFLSYLRPVVSPDGTELAYATNNEGRVVVWLQQLGSGKKRKLYKAGFSSGQKIDNTYPLLSWHPSGEILAYVVEEKGNIWLYFHNLKENSTQRRVLFDFQKITSFSYAPDGQQLLMSAVRHGKPDVYVFNIAANSHRQITDDYYTDLDPVFFNGMRQIVFSSNRPGDTIRQQDTPDKQPGQFDLFSYDFVRHSPVLQRVTETPLANETKPFFTPGGRLFYLNDGSGFQNLNQAFYDSAISYVDTAVHYRYFFKSQVVTGLTTAMNDYAILPSDDKVMFTALSKNRIRLFRTDIAAYLRQEPEQIPVSAFMQEKMTIGQAAEEKTDALPEPVAQSRRHFVAAMREAVNTDTLAAPNRQKQGGFAIEGQSRMPFSGLMNKDKPSLMAASAEPKRRNYNVEFYYDQLFTQVDFTYINYSYQAFSGGGSPIYLNPGFNVFLGVNLTDLLEDYRISGGVRMNTNLTNNEYVASFSNLQKRLDKQIIFHRQSIEQSTETYLMRTHSHELYYILSWPFSESLSLKGTGIYRNDMKVYLATDQVNLKKPNLYEHWAGLRTELVFDNSRELGMNLYSGIRSKAFAEYYQIVGERTRNLVVVGFDFRHYLKIHRNFIWANRLAASTSIGNNRLIYYMGGVDNWLFPSFNRTTPIDYNQQYAYQTLATNMRGFNQNIRNGNSFAVLNSELRFPVFRCLLQRPINSDFIRNFQLATFGDIGTAWTGLNPYDPKNSLYTSTIENGPLTITVEVQKDPIVGGFGFGARTLLLGYFVRGDVAWGVEDRRISKPVFYLSFSLDF
ncbi:MAG: hypothetical protein KKD74_01190 [Bacteroidetes bacterium]|nr:hypothetical protein [Bacteroidota bacterium]